MDGHFAVTRVLKPVEVKSFGVTIGLTLGAVLVILAMHVAAQFGAAGTPAPGVENWYRVDLLILGNAALGGLLADGARLAVAACWPAQA